MACAACSCHVTGCAHKKRPPPPPPPIKNHTDPKGTGIIAPTSGDRGAAPAPSAFFLERRNHNHCNPVTPRTSRTWTRSLRTNEKNAARKRGRRYRACMDIPIHPKSPTTSATNMGRILVLQFCSLSIWALRTGSVSWWPPSSCTHKSTPLKNGCTHSHCESAQNSTAAAAIHSAGWREVVRPLPCGSVGESASLW